jgi:hypothetical protein
MIYLSGPGLKIVILETANLDELKQGRPAHSPDGEVLIAWMPLEMLPCLAQDDSTNASRADVEPLSEVYSVCFPRSIRTAYFNHLFRC